MLLYYVHVELIILLKIPGLNLRYARAAHAKSAKGMPFPMYGVLCLTTFLCVHDPEF